MSGAPILIVDDHPANMKLITFLLEKRGYEVRTASSAMEVLEMLSSFRPRLILTDLQMPEMDGFELTRRLKANPETKDIIVIAVTAYAMRGDEARAKEAGCDGYVTKPIDTRALPTIIEEHLAKGRSVP